MNTVLKKVMKPERLCYQFVIEVLGDKKSYSEGIKKVMNKKPMKM